ncbi:hypothetical protein [Streptosporangium minutum]|uniref:Uncharacterized protein n=1 Tax=Streptosporangium minutum TaxID=569862 RepID=A0A243RXZ4_9ACTN|nr:hypothetical protein [Streptosporangium minutum]OUD00075.1 hypothetical protein CA984_00045 [Streptosporangium minutum]
MLERENQYGCADVAEGRPTLPVTKPSVGRRRLAVLTLRRGPHRLLRAEQLKPYADLVFVFP